MTQFGKGCHLHLIDGSAFIFRAYHALPPLTRKSDGLPIGAVSGFCNMLQKYVEDNAGPDAPTHVAVIFDKGSHTFRNDLYDQYKANREEMPEDLRPQIPLTREATIAFNIACKELEGYEADDIIATLSRQAREAGGRVTIISSDKDLMQLVGDGVEMLDAMKVARIYDRESDAMVRFSEDGRSLTLREGEGERVVPIPEVLVMEDWDRPRGAFSDGRLVLWSGRWLGRLDGESWRTAEAPAELRGGFWGDSLVVHDCQRVWRLR